MARWFVDRLPQRGIPSVSLRRLLPEARFLGCADFEVSGCTSDSRRLDPGHVFVALRGPRHDGHAFVRQAIERGAAGVVVERPLPEAGRLQVVVPDSRSAHARLCQALAGDPSEQLMTFGVTGGAGRSIAALYLRAIMEAAGGRYGLLGPRAWSDGLATRPVGSGPPRAEALASMLSEMVERGCLGAVLELDPEALDRRRPEGVSFDVALVTSLGLTPGTTLETILARRASMARLFRLLSPGGTAVVNADDPHAELLGAVNLDVDRVSFAIHADANITARVDQIERTGTRLRLLGFDREAAVVLRLPGETVVSHALAAAAAAFSRGVDLGAVVAGLESVATLPGRLETIDEGQPFDVRVEESSLPGDLQEALLALRSITPGRIHCVIGAEGHRQHARAERLALSATAEALSDRLTLTADNPRTENPDQILDDLIAGLSHPGRARVEPDRRLAIQAALADALPGDAVLIAGKGRQTFQILADRVLPFDDSAIVRSWLRRHRATRRTSA